MLEFVSSRIYSDDDLQTLTRIYVDACTELGIDMRGSDTRRESVAYIIMDIAQSGEPTPEVILRRTLMHLRHAH